MHIGVRRGALVRSRPAVPPALARLEALARGQGDRLASWRVAPGWGEQWADDVDHQPQLLRTATLQHIDRESSHTDCGQPGAEVGEVTVRRHARPRCTSSISRTRP